MIAGLVPVKGLAAGKSRLEGALPRASIARLILAMLADAVAALRGVAELDAVAVVTLDATVAAEAERLGARPLHLEVSGLSASVDAAARLLAGDGYGEQLVLLGDVAGATSRDLRAMIEARQGLGARGVVLAPSRDGGSSALLRMPHDVVASRFGKESAAAHRELTLRGGVPYCELPLPSLALDLDRPEDLEAFLGEESGGPATRALLREILPARPSIGSSR